ncbi:hypothetical protein AS9A_4100 [Hoyosella subflava DQS3-9A1]|uniref:Class I SAM-dependent methyltransferase n=2 Tax=Hoyosella TaxID=697025 RepID=F6EJB8_HOYSD|nr:hypothetical protein AS9A_4100 [Hoyosella subflava DQS3-9A1]
MSLIPSQPMATEITPKKLKKIKGWFSRLDQKIFKFLLNEADDLCGGGDAAEIGVYLGKSAVLIGSYMRPGEVLTVVDLFGAPASDDDNREENKIFAPKISIEKFRENFLRFHPELPVTIQGLSSVITDHASHGSHKFVHVDASHQYEHAKEDIASARVLLKPQGIVAVDDYLHPNYPGVGAALWDAVAGGLNPVLLTPFKFYGTWGDPQPWKDRVAENLDILGAPHEEISLRGTRVHRFSIELPVIVRKLLKLS